MLEKKNSASLFNVVICYTNDQVKELSKKLPVLHTYLLDLTSQNSVHLCSEVWSKGLTLRLQQKKL